MKYSLFLDDDRSPGQIARVTYPDNVGWTIVRNFADFIGKISKSESAPQYVSLDHDLCTEHYNRYLVACSSGYYNYEGLSIKTGLDALKWLIRYCDVLKKPMPKVFIHSLNEFGARNMQQMLDDYMRGILPGSNLAYSRKNPQSGIIRVSSADITGPIKQVQTLQKPKPKKIVEFARFEA